MVHVDETGKTTFVFRSAARGQVYLVGDFCHWQTDHLPMRQTSPHEWTLMLRLPPGVYEFRYFSDACWFSDYAAFGVAPNAFREFNSILRVPKVRPVVVQPARARRTVAQRLAASA